MDRLILVNRDNPVPAGYSASIELASVKVDEGFSVPLERETAEMFLQLRRRLLSAGIHIEAVSGYRYQETQERIWNESVAAHDDALDPSQDPRAHELRHLLKYGQDIPQWSYEAGQNVIVVHVPRTSSAVGVLKFCYRYADGEKHRLAIGFFVQLIGAGFNIGASSLVARLIVHYNNNAIEQAALAAVMIFACVMLKEFTICISEWLYNKISRHVLKRVQDDLVRNVLSIQSASMNVHGNAVFIRRMTDDAETLSTGLTDYYNLLIQICGFIGTLVAVFAVSWELFIYEAVVLYNYHTRLGSKAVFTVMNFSDFTCQLRLAGDRIRSLIVSREFPKEYFGDKHLDRVTGNIEFRDVVFSYPVNGSLLRSGKVVLDHVSFTVGAGKTVAFAGNSGCGKSTIFNLLNKQYTPDAGAILLDGEDVATLDKDTVRGSMAVITQFPYLFNASIRENLAYAKPDMTDEEMIRVCRACCIHDDIMRMENGYDSMISEGGRDLSGGQRQRLAIARGLLCDSPILLMDESTSVLDNTTQRDVLKAVKGLVGKRTVMIIAHRLSTIVSADTIFFVSGGKIIASGTHDELMETCSEYQELYQAEQVATEHSQQD